MKKYILIKLVNGMEYAKEIKTEKEFIKMNKKARSIFGRFYSLYDSCLIRKKLISTIELIEQNEDAEE